MALVNCLPLRDLFYHPGEILKILARKQANYCAPNDLWSLRPAIAPAGFGSPFILNERYARLSRSSGAWT
jgi:hypothetical protein